MNPVEPIIVADTFAALHAELLSLLSSLSAEDWDKPTVAGAWTVKDIAAHLLDSDVRRLSFQRDGMPLLGPDSAIDGYRDLVDFLNQLNAEWVRAAKRISPKLLIEFLAVTGDQVAGLFKSLDPDGPAIFSVAWAGEEVAPNWFDIAREYTEKWHHQQQIRDAVGAPGLASRKWLFPVLDTFLRGLPHTYRDVKADDGVRILFTVTGEAGGEWTLARGNGVWKLYAGSCTDAVCEVRLDQDTAWRMMTKGISREEAAARAEITGRKEFA